MERSALPPSISALRNQVGELAVLLEKWANINSGSAHAAGLERMCEALRAAFSTLAGAEIETVALTGTAARALHVRMRPVAPVQILLSGHYDTVYGVDHPFQTCTWLDARALRGPGVADMKGGLVVMLAALRAFEQTAETPSLGWEVLLTPDEETGSHASAPLLADAAKRHHFGLVCEPARANGDVVHSRKGTGVFVVTCHGRAGHAAKVPNDGRNAIVALAEYLVKASRVPEELPGILLNVGRVQGGSSTLNVVPAFAEAELDVRVTQLADQQTLIARLNELAAPINAREGLRVDIAGSFNRPPKECGAAEEAVFAEWQSLARELQIAPFSWVHAGGGSDGNFLSAAGLPNLDGVGVIGDHLHSDREYCVVPSLAERAQIVALFLHRVACGEIKLSKRS